MGINAVAVKGVVVTAVTVATRTRTRKRTMMRWNERSKVNEDVVYPASLVVNTSVSCIYDTDQYPIPISRVLCVPEAT